MIMRTTPFPTSFPLAGWAFLSVSFAKYINVDAALSPPQTVLSLRSSSSQRRDLQLSTLTDEFNDPSSLSDWTNLNPNTLASITISNGIMTLEPENTALFGWYGSSEGAFLSKSLSGNFVVEASLTVELADGSGLPPTGNWHSSGLLVRSTSIGGTDDFMMINMGRQGASSYHNLFDSVTGTQSMETTNGSSNFNYRPGSPTSGRLRICRVGTELALLRHMGAVDTGWTWESTEVGIPAGPINRPDISDSVDVGVMLSRWSNGADFVSEVDYVRFGEPTTLGDCFVDELDEIGGTLNPSVAPSGSPSVSPTGSPTAGPIMTDATASPSGNPTDSPTGIPSAVTDFPSESPTEPPSSSPTSAPMNIPSTPTTSLASLSDDFFNPNTLTDWLDHHPDNHNYLAIQDGVLTIIPSDTEPNNVWYNDWHGTFLSKEVTGNFVVETAVNVRVDNPLGEPPQTAGLPEGAWHGSGLLIMSTTDDRDWLQNNVGNQGVWAPENLPQTYGMESKTTVDHVSTFNYSPDVNAQANPSGGMSAQIRLCRVGNDIWFLNRFMGQTSWSMTTPVPGGIPGPVDRSDLFVASDTVHVGIMAARFGEATNTYTARIDYIRFAEANSYGDCVGYI